jgi:hypothetical protein
MDEILKKLLESELLNEDTKAELSESFNAAVQKLREEVATEVKVELTEQFVKAQADLVEAVDKFVNDQVAAEFTELKEDINSFRDVETEKELELAEKLVEEKERMATLLAEQIDELVTKIDSFLDKQVNEEFAELKEDIEDVQRLQFGRKIFESYEAEFKKFRKVDTLEIEQELAEAKDKLADASARLEEIERDRLSEARNNKLSALLGDVDGVAKDQLTILLSNVPVEKLDEAFKKYAPRVLKESFQSNNSKAILESTAAKDQTVTVTGNELNEEVEQPVQQDDKFARIRKLAGITG